MIKCNLEKNKMSDDLRLKLYTIDIIDHLKDQKHIDDFEILSIHLAEGIRIATKMFYEIKENFFVNGCRRYKKIYLTEIIKIELLILSEKMRMMMLSLKFVIN